MSNKFRSWVAIIMMAIVVVRGEAVAFAQSQCTLQSSQCVDSTPCKTISGTQVCLSTVSPLPAGAVQTTGDCWQYSSTYLCDTLQIDTCSSNPDSSCPQVSATCAQTDPTSGQCELYNKTYSCTTAASSDTTPTSNSTCADLINKGCTFTSSQCIDNPAQPTGCNTTAENYSCPSTTGAGSSTSTTCSGSQMCIGSDCYGTTDAPNSSLAKTVTNLEIARQLGAYAGSNIAIFSGYDNRCDVKLGGLGNCCKVQYQGQQTNSNYSLMGTVGTVAANYVGKQAANAALSQFGSKFTYDTLFTIDDGGLVSGLYQDVTAEISSFTQSVADAIGIAAGSTAADATSLFSSTPTSYPASIDPTAFNPSSFASDAPAMSIDPGLTTTAASGGTQLGSYYGVTIGFDSSGSLAISFCVWCLVIQLIITAIMDWLACTPPEMELGLKRGQNLCHSIGSYCSMEIPIIGTCIQTTQTYCCFNSQLALILNEQGRPQIGKGWGGAESPDCSGFSMAQLSQIDFSKIDYSAFAAAISASVIIPSSADEITAVQNNTSTQPGVTAEASLIGISAEPTALPCFVTWGAKKNDPATTTTVADVQAPLTVSQCQLNQNIQWTYTGSCSAITNGTEGAFNMALDGNGTATKTMYVPSTCATSSDINTWHGTVYVGAVPVQQIDTPAF
jgi:conjugal transfer mating pair stabilization protein TraN